LIFAREKMGVSGTALMKQLGNDVRCDFFPCFAREGIL